MSYLLSILDETNFSIENAYGAEKTKIAGAQLTLQNAESGKPYGVEVTFSNSVGNQLFSLHLDGHRTLLPFPTGFSLVEYQSPVVFPSIGQDSIPMIQIIARLR